MKYVIQYTFHWVQLGCDCCTDWESEIHVYEEHRVDDGVYTSYMGDLTIMYDEDDLRKYINDNCPEFNNFELHPYSYFA